MGPFSLVLLVGMWIRLKLEIRSRYLFSRCEGLEEGEGVPLLGTDLIGNTVGTFSFAGGQPIQQGK